MKCKTVNKNLILYFNNEISEEKKNVIQNHLKTCNACYRLYSELEATYNLIGTTEKLSPNPFLYTSINQKLINLKNKENKIFLIPGSKNALQTALMSFFIIIAVVGGILLGNLTETHSKKQVLISKTTEYYFNDLSQEKIETFLLNKSN